MLGITIRRRRFSFRGQDSIFEADAALPPIYLWRERVDGSREAGAGFRKRSSY
jgi:hypothetical protein